MSIINDIVISGMLGRFPSSRNGEEFKQNLYGGVDMVINNEAEKKESRCYRIVVAGGGRTDMILLYIAFFKIVIKKV